MREGSIVGRELLQPATNAEHDSGLRERTSHHDLRFARQQLEGPTAGMPSTSPIVVAPNCTRQKAIGMINRFLASMM